MRKGGEGGARALISTYMYVPSGRNVDLASGCFWNKSYKLEVGGHKSYSCYFLWPSYSEGFPVNTGGTLQRSYELVPLLKDNRVCFPSLLFSPSLPPFLCCSKMMHIPSIQDKRGLALDGQIKHEDTCLASSTM